MHNLLIFPDGPSSPSETLSRSGFPESSFCTSRLRVRSWKEGEARPLGWHSSQTSGIKIWRNKKQNDGFEKSKLFFERLYNDHLTSTTINCPMDFTRFAESLSLSSVFILLYIFCNSVFDRFPFDCHTCFVEVTSTHSDDQLELAYFKRDGEETW